MPIAENITLSILCYSISFMYFCACFFVLFSGFEANIFFLVLQFYALQCNSNRIMYGESGDMEFDMELYISQVSAVIFHILQAM